MQDFLVIGALFGAIAFFVYARTNFLPWAYIVSAILFFICGIGILQTGYETYSGSSATVTDSGNSWDVSFTPKTTLASMTGTADNQLLFFVGNISLALTLLVFMMGVNEAWKNREARKLAEE